MKSIISLLLILLPYFVEAQCPEDLIKSQAEVKRLKDLLEQPRGSNCDCGSLTAQRNSARADVAARDITIAEKEQLLSYLTQEREKDKQAAKQTEEKLRNDLAKCQEQIALVRGEASELVKVKEAEIKALKDKNEETRLQMNAAADRQQDENFQIDFARKTVKINGESFKFGEQVFNLGFIITAVNTRRVCDFGKDYSKIKEYIPNICKLLNLSKYKGQLLIRVEYNAASGDGIDTDTNLAVNTICNEFRNFLVGNTQILKEFMEKNCDVKEKEQSSEKRLYISLVKK